MKDLEQADAAARHADGQADEARGRIDIGPTGITSQEALLTVLAHKKPGDTATVTAVNLHGAKHTYKVTLGELNVYANG